MKRIVNSHQLCERVSHRTLNLNCKHNFWKAWRNVDEILSTHSSLHLAQFLSVKTLGCFIYLLKWFLWLSWNNFHHLVWLKWFRLLIVWRYAKNYVELFMTYSTQFRSVWKWSTSYTNEKPLTSKPVPFWSFLIYSFSC